MIKPNTKIINRKKAKARKILDEIRALAKTTPSPFQDMSQQQVIAHLRKSREELWNASHPRHQ